MPKYRVVIQGETYMVEVPDPDERPVRAIVNGEVFEVDVERSSAEAEPVVAETVAATPAPAKSEPRAVSTPLSTGPAGSSPSRGGENGKVTAPLPGTIVAVSVNEGDRVEHGQELCVLEAMKMNNPIRASHAGVVQEIYVSVGQQVQHGDPLMVITEA